MIISIFTLEDELSWREALQRLPSEQQQPFMWPEWYKLFEKNGYGRAYCFYAEHQGNTALYPFLKNSINEAGYSLRKEYYDIQGAPGYNGISASTGDEAFIEAFNRSFSTWCIENKIVAEFSRCNPVNDNHRFFPAEIISEANRNIIADLQDTGGVMGGYDRSAVKNIRRAEREGLTVEIIPGSKVAKKYLDSFTSIYAGTMERNNADREYFHSRSFFADVADELGDSALFCFTILKGTPIAAEIVITGGTAAYSWLGGTHDNYYPLRPNDILKDRIINHLSQAGARYFCLGGGLTPGDGIFRYKRSFALKGEEPFYIARRIHLPDIYEEVMQAWQKRHPDLISRYGRKLLAYRES